jgi:hypothetical protein
MESLPVKSKDRRKGFRIEEEVIESDKTQKEIGSWYTGIMQNPDKNPVTC